MASATFNLTGVGNQDSSTITTLAGEKVRVRFTSTTGTPNIFLAITANGVTDYIPIDNRDAWMTDGVLAADVVGVRMRGNAPTDNVTGIVESGA